MATIEVFKDGDQTIVRVDGFAAVSGSVSIDSCNVWSPSGKLGFPKPALDAIAERLADSGKKKGRVLYARHVEFPSGESTVVAVFCIHIETAQARILYTAAAPSLIRPQSEYAIRQLVECMRKVARENACACLEWVVHSEREAKSCCKDHSFRRVSRRGSRYAGLRLNDYLLEFRL